MSRTDSTLLFGLADRGVGSLFSLDILFIREIDRRGHELASHGYSHKFVTRQHPSEFREDLRRSIHSVQDLTGRKVLGYRAPYASITEWALDILGDEGLRYDSSYYINFAIKAKAITVNIV